ncbi:MAG: MoaA/NifB/PqqE/SkfB family radical SAM enzyme [Myxococcota bacterium]
MNSTDSDVRASGDAAVATLAPVWLDTLWLQVTGTVCNIACKHCFISCGPKVTTHDLMSVAAVSEALDDACERGLRAAWFTGGEPFIHPQIRELITETLRQVPLGILTNGMLIDAELAQWLEAASQRSDYNLEIRVSLDGCTREDNDRVRGRGVFDKTTLGIANLARVGLEPIIAVTLLDDGTATRAAFVELLRGLGVRQPRVKWIPPFRIGREERRRGGRAYAEYERLTTADLDVPDAAHRLQCGTSRTVTSQGVFPCPILINEPEHRLGERLGDAMGPHRVDHPACSTCWAEGFSCSA